VTNILLITTDQQRADSLGVYGNPVCQTPNLDRLAAQGTRYTACRTQNPYCQPSRATILTGTYPSTHGVTSNGIDLPDDAVARALPTLLGQAGYRSALIGKAHFASTYPVLPTGKLESVPGSALMAPDWTGPYMGFDHVELLLFGHNMRIAPLMGQWTWCFGPPPFGLHYARWLFRDGNAEGVERLRLMQPEAAGAKWDHTQTWNSALPEEHHPSTWVGDRSLAYLDEAARDARPFFAWVSFTDPHHPMDPPAPWSDLYGPDDVLGHLPEKRSDDHEGKPPVHAAWARGARGTPMEWANPGGALMSDFELATMTAGYYALISQLDHQIGRILDHLDALGLTDDTLVMVTTDHGELMGDHQMLFKGPLHYEGLLRLPLIVRGAGFPAGAVVDDPVGTIDLAPTALAAADLERPDWMEGAVLPPLDPTPREHVLTENDHQMVITLPLRTITTARWKLTRYEAHDGVGELYDLDGDPGEFDNRWDDPTCAAAKAELLTLLDDVMNHDVRREPMTGVVA
jgi:arylsulfatase A-like enzyme